MTSKLKFERIKDMPKLKKEIISYLFDFISQKPQNQWWKFKGEFSYEDKTYELECDVRMDNQMFTYRNLFIEHKQVVIDVDEMVKRGLLN